ncbi:chromate transporter [Sphingomonas sp. Leaf33]|uniref:chromate efflux transporter n=1 Tax=Sphingomonas sp. Leaf33 TaxID=1736215 RepID=UPI0006F73BA1|nr:chromate efflux transporter [Sphingomonas sp. Leaf33]KQN24825.1 chromate transporter [Sphingomonas sp. Leaf33]
MTIETATARPPAIGLGALFLKFLRFGIQAFGGPVAQSAMVREALVERERWIDRGRFNRLLAVLQVLPGPEAHELCVHLGMVARGRLGGLLAGLGFMLPGFVLMLFAGWAYTAFIAGHVALGSALLGVQVAVLAIIARAVVRIGEHVLEDRWLWAVAGVCLAATLAGVPFTILLAAGGAAYALAARPLWVAGVVALAIGAALFTASLPTPPMAITTTTGAVTTAALFIAGLKGGLLTFGGAYTAIPYVRADTVGRGWLSDATFLDGIALAGVLPAPLVIFATFVGYVAGGLSGAVAITLGMFLPAFAFSLIFFERLEAIVERPALHRLLAGVAAAVVGIIAATLVQIGAATVARVSLLPVAATLFVVTLAVVWRVKGVWVAPAVLAVAGVAGWAAGV